MSERTIRIGCASGFYGDSQLAATQLVRQGEIDYLVFDYLAEITMAILGRAKAKNDQLGFAVDFVSVAMQEVLADCAAKGIKVIANAGGVNVPACIRALEALCAEQQLSLNIAGVYGDDLLPRDDLPTAELTELASGQPLPEKLASSNAYLGAKPIADALAAGADVVVTGRVVDCAVVLGPLMHEFAWLEQDYDLLAQGALAGHIIECGAQCCGGNFTDWQRVPNFDNIGYPIAEVSASGSFIITKPEGTGGLVETATVGEQILYEIGDPANYLLPDVICDFSQVRLEQVAEHQVQVTGARGRAPGNRYKVCATWVDGWRLAGMFFIGGPRAAQKARVDLDAWLSRTRRHFAERNLGDYQRVCQEVIGAEDTYGPHATVHDSREVMAKYAVHHHSREALQFAAAELTYLATSGVPGMSGIAGGRARPQPLMRLHSTLIDKGLVPITVQLGERKLPQQCYQTPADSTPASGARYPQMSTATAGDTVSVPLEQLAFARSGDKGNHANIGIIARCPEYLPWLQQQLTAAVVTDYFSHLIDGQVTRFDVPGFDAFNFLLTESLGGGGAASLRIDPQGKALGQMLLSMRIEVPANLLGTYEH